MAIDHSNTIWAMSSPYLIRIGSDGFVSLTNVTGAAYDDGICVDSANNLYYSDYSGNKIYRLRTNGVLEVFAGSGNSGAVDGNGIFTSFSKPSALACDAADNIYVWDSGNDLIRRIDQNRNVTTIAGKYHVSSNMDGVGTKASFVSIHQMCFDSSGNLYLACGDSIRMMDARTNVVTLAGSFTQGGYTNGPGNLARFNGADGICLSGGTIYVADSNNQRIRSITNNPTPQVVSPADLHLDNYPGLQISGIVGRTYQIQASPDLNTWNSIATVLLTSSPYLWIDHNPTHGEKFYRAVLLP